MLPFLIFLVGSIWLSAIDLKTHKLPNQVVALVSTVLVLALLFTQPSQVLKDGFEIAFVYLGTFLLLWFISKGSLGMGDVKFSFTCGLLVGSFCKNQWLAVIWVMFALAAFVSAILYLAKKLNRTDRIACGPYMAIATICFVANSLGSGFA